MTNNSTKSRKGYLGKFTSLGLNVSAEEIYSSSYAAAAYLESINFPKEKKVPAPIDLNMGYSTTKQAMQELSERSPAGHSLLQQLPATEVCSTSPAALRLRSGQEEDGAYMGSRYSRYA